MGYMSLADVSKAISLHTRVRGRLRDAQQERKGKLNMTTHGSRLTLGINNLEKVN